MNRIFLFSEFKFNKLFSIQFKHVKLKTLSQNQIKPIKKLLNKMNFKLQSGFFFREYIHSLAYFGTITNKLYKKLNQSKIPKNG